jgi:hypothetical protein
LIRGLSEKERTALTPQPDTYGTEVTGRVKLYPIFLKKFRAEGPHKKKGDEVHNASINIRKIVGGYINSRKLPHSPVLWQAYMVAVIKFPFL